MENSSRSSHSMHTFWQGWDAPFHTKHKCSNTQEKPFQLNTQLSV